MARSLPGDKKLSILLSLVWKNPSYSLDRILAELPEVEGKKIFSRSGTYKALTKLGLNTVKKRRAWARGITSVEAAKTFAEIVAERIRRKLTPEERLEMIRLVEREEMPASRAAQANGVSRKNFYKWKKRYEASILGKEYQAVCDQKPVIERRWNQLTDKQIEAILKIVREHPEYSTHKVAQIIAGVGNHGVQNVFQRQNLSIYEKRLAYAEAYRPIITPVTGVLDRIKPIFGKIPVISAIPPPLRYAQSKLLHFIQKRQFLFRAFTFSFLSSIAFSTAFIYWLGIVSQAPTFGAKLGLFFATIALGVGSAFFAYSMKYYLTLAIVLSFSRQPLEEGGGFAVGLNGRLNNNNQRNGNGWLARIFGIGNGPSTGSGLSRGMPQAGGLQPSLDHIKLERYPFISIHLPFYNEKKVANRILSACTSMDYENYEVIVIDDSTDETVEILEKWKSHPKVKIIHRETREGFKGGALREALRVCDPRTEFVVVFDADFIPYPDTLELFIKYFKANNNGSEDYKKSNVACVAGYQWHVLNKSENWITRGVRTEYAGSYVIERPGQEILGAMKLIHGSVYAIRADLLKKFGWGTSITEDFELTLRLYEQGYKVVYTPYVQGPAECVSTIKRLIRQRMRWAEGHSHNIRKMFFRLLSTPNMNLPEKLEFLYLSPYYLQAFFFLIGTFSWLLAETVFRARLPFWTSLWGWSLVLTNFFSLPLVNAVGLFLEEAEEKDYLGIFSFVALSYLLVPFQAYASVKGFLEKEEGPWFRTPKTGLITDIFTRGRFYRWISGIIPGRVAPARISTDQLRMSTDISANQFPISANPYLALATANNQFDKFLISRKQARWVGRIFLVILLILSTTILSLAPTVSYFIKPKETQAKGFGTIVGPQGNLTQTGKSITDAYPDSSNLEELKPKEISPSTYAFKTLEGDVIEIGTEKHSPPQPYLKLEKWDGEVSLKVNIPFQTGENPSQDGDKLRYSTTKFSEAKKHSWLKKLFSKILGSPVDAESKSKVDIEFYPKQPEEITEEIAGQPYTFKINEEGGVEFDTILYEKPEKNQIIFPIETQGLKFYYQPPLHPDHPTWADEDGDGEPDSFRPESVVGSYAVYHESKQGDYTALGGKNYRAGKAFHIYRPKVTDASGREIWGELKIDKGILSVTIPQEFLDKAVYPVKVDPTFGYTTKGTTSNAFINDNIRGTSFTPTSGGTVNSLTAFVFYNYETVYQYKFGIYNDDASFLGGTVEGDSTGTLIEGWRTLNASGSFSVVASTPYYLVGWAEKSSLMPYDAGGTGILDAQIYGAWPDPFAETADGDKKYSIYATYTAAGQVDTSTSSSATAYSFQRKTWYDGTRLWSAFYSGTEIEFWYSADWGSNWTQNASATIAVSTNDFTIEADTADAFIAYTDGYDIKANEDTGTYPATNFAWGASPTTVYDGSSTTDEYDYPAMTKDSNNKVWTTARHYGSASPYLYLYHNGSYEYFSDFLGGATFIDITGRTDIVGNKVRLKITEEMDEVAYIDRVYLRVNGDNNNIIELSSISKANKDLLLHSDNDYLIMKKGAEHYLEFPAPQSNQRIEFAAEGYYLTRSSLVPIAYAQAEPAQEWREVTEKRNRASKTKQLYVDGQPTNKYSYDGTIGPMHYKDAGDAWQDIHTELVPSTRSIVGFGNPAFEMTENEYEMFILGALSSGVPVVRYVTKNTDYWVQFAAHNLQWTNDLDQISLIATPPTTATQTSGGEAKWPDAYGAGRDIRYIAGAGRMQKWLDIASPLPAPPQFIIDGGNPVVEFAEILEFHPDLEVWVNGQKWNKKDDVGATAEIEFRSPDGQVQFVFPVAMGYHEGMEDASVIGKLHLKKAGAKLYVTARFPLSWVQTATYPIHLDQTVDKQVAASTDDCFRRLLPSYLSLTAVEMFAGDNFSTYYDYSIGMRFLAIGIVQGATIDLSYMSIKAFTLTGTIPTTYIQGEAVNDAATFSTAADYDGRTRTTASVAWTPAAWVGGTWYNSTEIKTVIQEIINRAGWVSGNDLVLFWRDAPGWGGAEKLLSGYSWDYAGNISGPKLHIEYTVATYMFKARQSTNANDISAWGTATTLDSSANSNKYGTIVSLGSGNLYSAWIDGTAIEGKKYTSGTGWDSSPTSIATGVTGLTNNMSAVSDSSGNAHLLYINSSDYAVYQEYTTSWQTAVTLDSTAGNDYPTISLNTSNNDLYALWIRSNVIYYKKGVSPYASANWDASATSWKATGTNTYTTSNYSGAGMIYATWTQGTGSPYSVMWDYIIIPERLWLLLGLGLVIPRWLRRTRLRRRLRRAREN